MNFLNYIWVLIFFSIFACNAGRNAVDSGAIVENNGEDSTTYDLIIQDPGFDSWFSRNAQPIGFNSESYYESENRIYVNRWNQLADQPTGGPFSQRINYDPDTDYPKELDYRLYYYFVYVETLYGARYDFPS